MARFDETTLERLKAAAQLGCSRREAAAIINASPKTARRDLDTAAGRLQKLEGAERPYTEWSAYSAHLQASYTVDKLSLLDNRRTRQLIADEVCDVLWP